LRLFGFLKSDEESSETYDCDDAPLASDQKRRNFAPLYTIYEENGEDEEFEICFKSYQKSVQKEEISNAETPVVKLLPYEKLNLTTEIVQEFAEDKKSMKSASTKCTINERVEDISKESSESLLNSSDDNTRASNDNIEIFDEKLDLPEQMNKAGKKTTKRSKRGKSSERSLRPKDGKFRARSEVFD
jgi:hypothetical protein